MLTHINTHHSLHTPLTLFPPQYLYNLEVYGHTIYTRRDKAELEAAQKKVNARAASGEIGPLSPI